MQHPEGLHDMKEELVKELKAKLMVPTDVRSLLSMSVPKCGEIKLRSFAAELLLVHYGEENMSAISYGEFQTSHVVTSCRHHSNNTLGSY